MPDVFEVLSTDHAEVELLLTALEESPGHSEGASEAVLDARGQAALRLVMDSSAHEAAEEQYFWPAVRRHVPNGEKLANEAISQESEAKEILDKLAKLGPTEPEFDELIAEFIPAARQHIEFEEGQAWPELRAVLSTDEAAQLGAQMTKAKERGPTRPHPHTPANPAVLKTAGSAAALVDRLRDAVTGRGRLRTQAHPWYGRAARKAFGGPKSRLFRADGRCARPGGAGLGRGPALLGADGNRHVSHWRGDSAAGRDRGQCGRRVIAPRLIAWVAGVWAVVLAAATSGGDRRRLHKTRGLPTGSRVAES